MLIFVGILVTSIFPFFLYVNEVNSYYNRVLTELSKLDEERGRENLSVYAYPIFNGAVTLNIYIRNRSTLAVTIVRVWVNNTNPSIGCLPLSIPGTTDATIEGIAIPSEGDFNVWVVTEKGNVFASLTNTIHIEEGEWSGGNPPYTINFVVQKKPGSRTYFINVSTSPPTNTTVQSNDAIIMTSLTIGYTPGTYTVTVNRLPSVLIYNQTLVITPENPSPWVYAYDP